MTFSKMISIVARFVKSFTFCSATGSVKSIRVSVYERRRYSYTFPHTHCLGMPKRLRKKLMIALMNASKPPASHLL